MDLKTTFTAKNISFLILILFIIFAITKMTDIALLLFCSYLISCSINPAIEKLSSKISRSLATSIMLLITTLIILGVFTPIITMAVTEIQEFLQNLPQQISNIQNFLNTFTIGDTTLSQQLNLSTVLNNTADLAPQLINKSIDFTISAFSILTIIVTVGIIVFFLSNDKKEIKNFTLQLFPIQMRNRASEVIDDLEVKVGGYITAQLFCITIVGIIVAICLSIMKVEYAIFLGFISAILDLVPIIGPVLAGILILLIAAPKGLLVAILGICSLLLGQFIENNWAKPYFFSKYMDLHPLVVIFSFIIAAKFLGVVGVLIAPAIAAVIVTLFQEIYIKTMNEERESQNNE